MKIIKNIISTNLFRITSLNSISIILKLFIGVITSKVIAIFIGPTGLALVGNFRNFLSSVQGLSSLGLETGVIKYVAQNRQNLLKLKKTVSTVFFILLLLSIILSFCLFFMANFFNQLIFGINYNYTFIFKIVAISLPFFVGNIFLVSIINGLGKYNHVIYITIFGSFAGLLLSVLLIQNYGINGALLSIVLTPSILIFTSLYFINKEFSILNLINLNFFNFSFLKSISSYSLMALLPVILNPFIMLSIRKNIILTIGINQAGYWEAITRISSYYLLFISTLLVVYFLPKLSESKSNLETRKIFFSYYKNILPLFILVLVLLFFVKDIVINILFTKEFLPVSKLFFWQLLGDVFKAASIILGYQFFAKKMTLPFIFFEITSFIIMYVSSIFFLKIFGIHGVVIAHCFTYFMYLVMLVTYFRKILFSKN